MAGSCLDLALMLVCQPTAGCRRGLASSLLSLELKNWCACMGSSSLGSSARENYSIGEHKGGKPSRAFLKRCDGLLVGLSGRRSLACGWDFVWSEMGNHCRDVSQNFRGICQGFLQAGVRMELCHLP